MAQTLYCHAGLLLGESIYGKNMVNLEQNCTNDFQRFSLASDLLNNIVKIEENRMYRNMFFFSHLKFSSFMGGSRQQERAALHLVCSSQLWGSNWNNLYLYMLWLNLSWVGLHIWPYFAVRNSWNSYYKMLKFQSGCVDTSLIYYGDNNYVSIHTYRQFIS